MYRKAKLDCHNFIVHESLALCFLVLLLTTQAIYLRGVLLPPSFHDLPMWSGACFWVAGIIFPSICSLQLQCFAMFYVERKVGGKAQQNWTSLISFQNDLAAGIFFSSPFSIVFASDTVLIIKITGKNLWSFWLCSSFFTAHWPHKHILTSDLGINFLEYNIFAFCIWIYTILWSLSEGTKT